MPFGEMFLWFVALGAVAQLVDGALGGVAGALVLVHVASAWIKPLIVLYLLALSVLILLRAARRWHYHATPRHVPPLGLVAGTLDAIGGGGWGSVTTSSLLAGGHPARKTLGTVAAAEFVVTLAIAATFASTIGLQHAEVVLGLLIGGALAAPFSAFAVSRLPERALLWMVGALVMALALVQAVKLLAD